jgi:hypothetical protein
VKGGEYLLFEEVRRKIGFLEGTRPDDPHLPSSNSG